MHVVLRNFVLVYCVTISNLGSILTFKIGGIASLRYFNCQLIRAYSIQVRYDAYLYYFACTCC